MAEKNHIVKKQVLDIHLLKGENVNQAQDTMLQLCKEKLLPAVQEVLDRFDQKDQHTLIDKLELDLGHFPLNRSDQEIEWDIKTAIQDQLEDQILQLGLEEKKTDLDLLDLLLRHGVLPWWAEEGVKIEGLLQKLLRENPQQLKALLRNYGKDQNLSLRIAKRLVLQVKSESVQELFFLLMEHRPELQSSFSVWVDMLPQMKEGFIGWLVAAMAEKNDQDQAFLEQVVLQVAQLLKESPQKLMGKLVRKFLGNPFNRAGKKIRLIREMNKALKSGTGKSEGTEKAVVETTEPDLELEEIYIENAGMILLWPFLETLFDFLGWTEEGQFLSEEGQFKAVFALQFLTEGMEDNGESDLALNKILCGMKLSEPIPQNMDFERPELEEMLKLLAAVVDNWEALGNTSPMGLQQNFLQREGRLEGNPTAWELTVDRKTMDVLLGQIPWAIENIKLPWMEKPLFITW